MKISHIVLTGGPCGGKTTALSYLTQKLQDKGLFVLIVPEAATLCIEGGISPICEIVGADIAQRAIIKTAFSLENIWTDVAHSLGRDVVILHDRGITDCKAYTDLLKYEQYICEIDLNQIYVRDGRYDAVVHLKTAADGAEEFYTLENNTARYETAEQARVQDQKIIDAWVGHPHLRVIDNSTNFENKIHRVLQEICSFLGIPVPIEREKKFLVRFDRNNLPDHAQAIDIEQIYLSGSDDKKVVRIRKRGQFGFYTYYETIKLATDDADSRIETERQISASEYAFGSRLIQKGTGPVKKKRTCFLFENQYFELDEYEELILPNSGQAVLEIELTSEGQEVLIPKWIEVERDVTGLDEFSNHRLSRMIARG